MIVPRVGLVLFAALVACASVPPTPVQSRYQVVVLPLADNALDFLYFAIADRGRLEAWFCLRGMVDPQTHNAIVSNISPVFVDSADGNNIHGRPWDCSRGADSASVIGTVHFHPSMGQCEFSEIDLVTAHHLPYELEAIMCRDDSNPRPHLQSVFRHQIDSAYKEIRKRLRDAGDQDPRTFTAVYRYVTPPPKPR